MKKFLTLAVFLFTYGMASAQKHVYEDLLVMYVDEKYEKCLAKAEGYTMGDETKRDALPFLYMSMCLFEMSKQEKYAVDYPRASRDAVKWAEKYRKKDKDREFFGNYEDYWAELNTVSYQAGENLLDDPKGLSKAKQIFDGMTGYYPENPGAWLMLAMSQYKSNLVKEGDLSVKEFDKMIAAAGDIGTLPKDQKTLLKNALIRYADYLVSKGQRDRAKTYAALGKEHFMEEADFKGLWDSLR
ncbi:MAG: hypothetical protein IPP83_05890 [Flavobacteriales bacterium]|nr:hypothetical protein [Flavobacteriales bacterium]MBL0126985.1 hypothetical protein [Flavobacteriales bacterium]MCC6937414.1 hypothetical protein [Flavobacteriales bacterium]